MARGMKRHARGAAALVAAAGLAVALVLSLGGCSAGENAVTERDLEVARQLGFSDDAMASMDSGAWPSDLERKQVRHAEACIDYLAERYGFEFSAVSATGEPKWLMHADDVVLRIESGPFAGEEVHLKYDDGMRDGRQEMEPRFDEDCYYVVNHEEWERLAAEAIAPVLAELPEGSLVTFTSMSRQLYPESMTSDPVSQGGGNGEVGVVIALDRCGLSESEAGELFDEFYAALQATPLRGRFYLRVLSDTSSLPEFSWQAVDEVYRPYRPFASRWFSSGKKG